MTGKEVQCPRYASLRTWLGTLAIVGIYAAVMVCTNSRFTFLDDEANSIAIAGRPLATALQPFFTGQGFHELHPPAAEILWHIWLRATHYSFFLLRVLANLLFIGTALFTAKTAEKVGGCTAYWVALLLAFVWPFAFQYGRLAGWYWVSALLLAVVTWAYFQITEDGVAWPWIAFGAASILFVWSNYFGFTFLFLLLADLVVFHRAVARKRAWSLSVVMAAIAVSFLPVLRVALQDVGTYVAPAASRLDWKNELAVAGYPSFAVFGSAAIAPWYLPLSVPVSLGTLALFAAIWFSRSRRWLVYAAIALVVLYVSGNLNIKRIPILLPWLFLAMGVAVSSRSARHPRIALSAVTVIVVAGWVGIVSGQHYATTNLYEPWGKVAEVVAQDARSGATIISANPPFFLYLDYRLGMGSETRDADSTFLDPALYRAHGYTILQPNEWQSWIGTLHGKVVMVNGSGVPEQVAEQMALNDALHLRCADLGEYHAAPDPAAEWKARFVKGAPLFAYRTNVIWYDCPQ